MFLYLELHTNSLKPWGHSRLQRCGLYSATHCVHRFRCRQATRLSGVNTRRTSTSTSTFHRSFLRRDCAAPSTGTRATTCFTESPELHQQCKDMESSTSLQPQAGGQWAEVADLVIKISRGHDTRDAWACGCTSSGVHGSNPEISQRRPNQEVHEVQGQISGRGLWWGLSLNLKQNQIESTSRDYANKSARNTTRRLKYATGIWKLKIKTTWAKKNELAFESINGWSSTN